MKKMLALLLALVMVLSLAACASSQPATTDAAASTETAETTETTETTEPAAEESAEAPAESGKTYTVGVCQLVQHEALDAATQGFIDALKEELGDAVTVDAQNASGDSVNCGTIVNGFVSKGVDLIMANATPALTAAVSATADIPILGTSITAYGVALDIDDFNGTVGGNVSGTSDLADLQAQAQMILDWFPETKTVGLLFCSAEPNSRYQIDEVRKALEAQGVTCEEFAFTDSNDVSSVTQKAADFSDVVYIPTDNTGAGRSAACRAEAPLRRRIQAADGALQSGTQGETARQKRAKLITDTICSGTDLYRPAAPSPWGGCRRAGRRTESPRL